MTFRHYLISLILHSILMGQMDPKQALFSFFPPQSEEADKLIDTHAIIINNNNSRFPAVFIERLTRYDNNVTTNSGFGYDWTLDHSEYTKLVVLNPEDSDFTTLRIDVPINHELKNAQLSILSPTGLYHTFGSSDLKIEQDSNGYKFYKFAFPDVAKGSIITKAYTVRKLYCLRNWPLDYEFQMQYSIPCQKASLALSFPYKWTYTIKKNNTDKKIRILENKNANNNTLELSYSSTDIQPLIYESFSPFHKEISDYVNISITSVFMKSDNYNAISYKSPQNWDDLSKEFKSYIMNRDPLFSVKLRQHAIDITKSDSSEIEKLDSVISWLQNNMRVISYIQSRANGMNRGNFSQILEKKEGTIVQITGLAISLLEKIGIDSKYALIHSARDGFFDQNYYSYSQLDHPGVYVEINGKIYLAFPYRKRMPVDFIPEEYQGQIALMVGTDGKSDFKNIPMGGESAADSTENYQITLKEDGKMLVDEERVLKGASAYLARETMIGKNGKSREDVLRKMLAFSDSKVTFQDSNVESLTDYRKPLTIRMKYEVDNLITRTPDEVILSTGGLFKPISRIKANDSPINRQNDIRIYFNETTRKKIVVNYPKHWIISTQLAPFSIENGFGSVSGNYQVTPGSLVVDQMLVLKNGAASKEKYPELQELTGRKTKHSIAAIVFAVKH